MRRRDFIKATLGVLTAGPVAARAQQQHPMPVMAFLKSTTPEDSAHLVRAFRQGLSEAGFAEGRNVTIEYRWAENQLDRLPELVAELVRRRVAVIATPADTPATLVAKAATTTIPIVFEIGGDPVRAGLVASFNQPGGNVTGITSMNLELAGKLLGLLHELLPQAARFAVLINPNNSTIAEATISDARAAAMSIGRQIEVLTAGTNREIDMAFASLGPKQVDALLVNNDPFFNSRRVHLITLATYHRLPTIYPYREMVEAGGLMSYLYPANDPKAPCFVHIHGGYWQRGSKEIFACLSEGPLARGWSAALCGYTLAPDATLTQITNELKSAFDWLNAKASEHGIQGPIIVTGWSAGGHLTSFILDHPKVAAGLAISGVFDLGALRDSPHVNDKVKLSEEEIQNLSPMRRSIVNKPLGIAYGTGELPAMIASSRDYHAYRSQGHVPGDLIPIA